MKIFLILLLLGLAALEFFHHLHDGHFGHSPDAQTSADAKATGQDQAQRARELLQQHLHGHR